MLYWNKFNSKHTVFKYIKDVAFHLLEKAYRTASTNLGKIAISKTR